MAVAETAKLCGKDIAAKELTVLQVKEMMETIRHDRVIDNLMDGDIPADLVALACGVSVDELEKAKPSELDQVWEAVRKVNPRLAGMVKNTTAIMEQLKSMSSSLPAVSAD